MNINKIRIELLYLIIIVIIIGTGCNKKQVKNTTTTNEISGTISISGAFALYPMTAKWAEEFQKIHPDIRIDISAGGAGKGMTDVLSGMVDLGMFSRGITAVEKAKGVWWIAVTQDAVLPTINSNSAFLANVRTNGFKKQDFIDVFIDGKTKTWDKWAKGIETDNTAINVYTRSDACGAAQMWAEYLGKSQEDLIGTGIFGDPAIAEAVKNDVLGIGYNNVIYAYDINTRSKNPGIEIIPIDINENGLIDPDEQVYNKLDDIMAAIQTGIYPSPPARDLYLISNGKPQNRVVKEFLKWIVTDGQKFVNEAGYVQISEEKLKNGLKKLED
ncbi:MAG: PstS family phosphate ABC transporter substrate-binding protein [Bacteroidales bacterium]